MQSETSGGGHRIVPEQDFTASHAPGLRELLERGLASATTTLLMDMGAVTAIDGRGLALLFGLAASCRRRGLVLQLAAVRPDLQHLLSLCHLPGVVEINGAAIDA